MMFNVQRSIPLLSRAARRLPAMFTLGLTASLVLGNVTAQPIRAQPAPSVSPATSTLDASFAVDWMQTLYDHVKAETVNAPAASRVYAYAGVTLYEAVRPGIPGDLPLSTQITGMPTLPAPDPSLIYDWPSVANAALQTVSDSLLPGADAHTATAALRIKQAADRTNAVGAEVVQRSLAQGDAIGKLIATWAASDGAAQAHAGMKTYKLPTGGTWDYTITTPGTIPVEPLWGTVRPFALEKASICDIPMNVPLSADPTSTLYKQALEVKNIGDHLTDEQKAIANWWVDTPGLTGAPSGHWISIAAQMVGDLQLKLDRTAEMYAMVGMALGDAFIACWELKYVTPYLRPVTYIQRYINPHWQSYIATPAFPTYDSGHSVASAAAAAVLTNLFGEIAFTDTTHVKEGQPARAFTSFIAARDEAATSRLYGGIHFRMDIENGVQQGQCVAQHLLANIHLHAASTTN